MVCRAESEWRGGNCAGTGWVEREDEGTGRGGMSTKAFTLAEVAKHNTDADCWLVIEGVVYDVTEFLSEHPGGGDIVVDVAGTSHRPPVRRARRVCFHHPPARRSLARSLRGPLTQQRQVYQGNSVCIERRAYIYAVHRCTFPRRNNKLVVVIKSSFYAMDSSIARALCQACVLPRYSDNTQPAAGAS